MTTTTTQLGGGATVTTYADGMQRWMLHGRAHRDDGPAVTRPTGYEEWCRHGWLHRTDGPAITWPADEDQPAGSAWYIHEIKATPEIAARYRALSEFGQATIETLADRGVCDWDELFATVDALVEDTAT